MAIKWEKSPDDNEGKNNISGYCLLRSTTKDGYYEVISEFASVSEKMKLFEKASASEKETVQTRYEYTDNIPDNLEYYYILKVIDADNNFSLSPVVGPVKANPQWFNTNRLAILIGSFVFISIVLVCIFLARGGKEFFVRKIAGLDAVDEAIGRATEMGKPILYVTGLGGIDSMATLASINILGRIAKKIAEYETPLIVPAFDYFVMMVQKEVVKWTQLVKDANIRIE